MALSRFHPFALRTPFDELFDVPTFGFPRDLDNLPSRSFVTQPPEGFWLPRHPYHVHEDDKTYMVSVDVPGVKAEDINLKIEDDKVLHLSGGRKIQKENGSFSESKFDYRMTLSDNVDVNKISANLQDGVLKLTAPKMEVKKPEARVINITEAPAPKQLDVEKQK